MDDGLSRHQFLHRVWGGAIPIITLCAQYSTLLMATGSTSGSKAQWNDNEITALLQYLESQKSMTEGVGSFKEVVWNNAPEAIKDQHTRGPVKIAKMCRNKWLVVC